MLATTSVIPESIDAYRGIVRGRALRFVRGLSQHVRTANHHVHVGDGNQPRRQHDERCVRAVVCEQRCDRDGSEREAERAADLEDRNAARFPRAAEQCGILARFRVHDRRAEAADDHEQREHPQVAGQRRERNRRDAQQHARRHEPPAAVPVGIGAEQRLHDRAGQIPEHGHRALIPRRQAGVRCNEKDHERDGARVEVVDAVSERDRQETAQVPIAGLRFRKRLCHPDGLRRHAGRIPGRPPLSPKRAIHHLRRRRDRRDARCLLVRGGLRRNADRPRRTRPRHRRRRFAFRYGRRLAHAADSRRRPSREAGVHARRRRGARDEEPRHG